MQCIVKNTNILYISVKTKASYIMQDKDSEELLIV
jgi:hypothetical protein